MKSAKIQQWEKKKESLQSIKNSTLRLLPLQKSALNKFGIREIALSTFGSTSTRIYHVIRFKKKIVHYLKMNTRCNLIQLFSLLTVVGKLLLKTL